MAQRYCIQDTLIGNNVGDSRSNGVERRHVGVRVAQIGSLPKSTQHAAQHRRFTTLLLLRLRAEFEILQHAADLESGPEICRFDVFVPTRHEWTARNRGPQHIEQSQDVEVCSPAERDCFTESRDVRKVYHLIDELCHAARAGGPM